MALTKTTAATSTATAILPNTPASPATNLIEGVEAELARERRAAWRRYAELLPVPQGDETLAQAAERAGRDPKAVRELAGLAQRLGRTTPGDIEADVLTLCGERSIRARIDAGRGAYNAAQRACAAVEAYDAESVRLRDERTAGYRKLYCAMTDLQRRDGNAREAVRELNALLDDHADLLGHRPRVRLAELDAAAGRQ